MGFKWPVHPQDNTGMCVRKRDMSDSHLSSSHAVKHLQEEKVLRCLSVYAGPVSFECAITTVIQVKSTSWVYKDCLGFLDVKKT